MERQKTGCGAFAVDGAILLRQDVDENIVNH
jgi:hypothetical protein